MTDHPYEVWDVFTDRPLAGNPLAVVHADALDPALMQGIAAEFGFSETTFVLPPERGGTARVRIFTPRQEVPFAGHPTIGTALALAERGPDLTLELGTGPVPVTIRGGRASLRNTTPLERTDEITPETVAACASLSPEAVRTDTHPPLRAGVGLPFAVAELASEAALAQARPATEAFRAAQERHPGPFDFALLVYVREGCAVQARVFAPLDDIPEDPATGSAASALAALLAETEGRDLTLDVRQGEAMGRPSRIEAAAELEGGRCVATRLTGSAVKVMEGRLCGF